MRKSLKHGGGSLWTPLSLDAKAGIVYLPVGNPAPDFYGEIRPGANLYTNSLVALDAKTGKLLWYQQFIPHDVHDADLSQVSPLFETTVGGKKRKVISVSGKDGLLRLLDRESQEQFYEVPITTRENVDALTDGGGRASLPRSPRRHGVERPCLRSCQQRPVRAGGRLVRHLQQGAKGPADHAGHALLRRRGRL